jgi:iron complex outermembrane recepter protein
MGRSSLKVLLAGGVAATALSGGAAHAQSAATPQTEPATVAELIVTANKREERLQDVANSVSAVEGETLLRRAELNLLDLSAQVPGLSVQRGSNPGLNRIIIRGQNSGGTGATVTTVVDEVPFSFASGAGNGGIITADIDPYDLRQIEILRGPQGTLHGAGAQGGIVKYVTNAPDPTGVEAAFETGLETVDHGETGAFVRGLVNLPLGETAAVRASGFYQDLPGFIDNRTTGAADENSGSKYGGRVALLWTPSDDFSLQLAAFHQRLETDGLSQVNVIGAPDAANPPPNQQSLSNGLTLESFFPGRQTNEYTYGYLDIDYDLGWADFTSITSLGEISAEGRSDISGALAAPGLTFATFLGGFVYGQPLAIAQSDPNKLEKLSQEFRLSSPTGFSIAGRRFDWQAGLFYTEEDVSLGQVFEAVALSDLSTPLAPALGGALSNAEYEELSAFAEVDLYITPSFDIAIGGRLSRIEQSAQVRIAGGLLVGPDQVLPRNASEDEPFTFSVAPRWRISDDTMIYGRIAKGFRPGGPNVLSFTPPPGFPLTYDSDSTLNYEVGFRTNMMEDRLFIDVTAFYIDWSDIQILTLFDGDPADFTALGNAGEAETRGVEWTVSWEMVDGLTLGVTGAYTDAKLKQDAPLLGGADGDRLAYVPRVQNSVNLDYQRPIGGDWSGFVGATWTHVGDRFTDFGATPLAVTHAELPSYNTFALRGGVENERYLAQVYVRNLTDERALLSYASTGSPSLLGVAGILQPRTFGVRLGVKY